MGKLFKKKKSAKKRRAEEMEEKGFTPFHGPQVVDRVPGGQRQRRRRASLGTIAGDIDGLGELRF